MANEKQSNILQQGKDDQGVDIKQLIFTALRYWYLFDIFVVIA